MKELDIILKRSRELRINSFELRNKQIKIFYDSNRLSIKSLEAALKGDIDKGNELWKQAVNKRDEAKIIGDNCQLLSDRANDLERRYYKIIEDFELKD